MRILFGLGWDVLCVLGALLILLRDASLIAGVLEGYGFWSARHPIRALDRLGGPRTMCPAGEVRVLTPPPAWRQSTRAVGLKRARAATISP